MRSREPVESSSLVISGAARRRRWVLVALIGLMLLPVSATWAGFDHPRGRQEKELQQDGAPLGRVKDRPAPETIRKLKAQFKLPNDAAAVAKLGRMRTNMMKMIDLLKSEDATIGACL